ncbi:hypothetical protein BHE74_00027401 [Ensete ventricosum]|nr:hypothetical protein BHE74_00027401 [Ensete ventricosum]
MCASLSTSTSKGSGGVCGARKKSVVCAPGQSLWNSSRIGRRSLHKAAAPPGSIDRTALVSDHGLQIVIANHRLRLSDVGTNSSLSYSPPRDRASDGCYGNEDGDHEEDEYTDDEDDEYADDEDEDEDDYDYADDEDSEDWQTVEDEEEEEVKVNEQIVGSGDAIEALKANSGNCVVIGGHERSARSHQNAGPGSGVGTAASISTTRRMRPHPSPFAGFTSSRWMTMTTTSRKRRRRRKVGIWGWTTTTTTTRKRPRRGELAAERIRYPREMIR